MYAVLELHKTILEGKDALCFVLSFIPCFFLGSSYAFGEAAMVAYLRLFPKTLIAGWSSGTGLSGLISGALNLMSQLIDGFSLKYLYLILFPVGIIYLILFMCTFRILKSQERRIEREERLSHPNMGLVRDSSFIRSKAEEETDNIPEENLEHQVNNEVEEDAKSIKEAEDKELEDMNKANQVFTCQNFVKVMHMVGRVLINLGIIYFLQFLCVNTFIVSVCAQRDIEFLPCGRNDENKIYRRGKFEFINLSYQVGMFLSKTFIKYLC